MKNYFLVVWTQKDMLLVVLDTLSNLNVIKVALNAHMNHLKLFREITDLLIHSTFFANVIVIPLMQ